MADIWNIGNVKVQTDDVLVLGIYTFATVPSAVVGGVIYVSNGAEGDPILAFSDGTNWLRSDTGAAIAAS